MYVYRNAERTSIEFCPFYFVWTLYGHTGKKSVMKQCAEDNQEDVKASCILENTKKMLGFPWRC